MKYGKWNCRGKMDSNFLAGAASHEIKLQNSCSTEGKD
jgi:hypothetical protein